jgi:Nodulation protein Z (NodZ)
MNGYVLVKGKAGLGNRMLAAMTGILYAMLSQRNLVVDWSDSVYSDDGQNVFPKLFKVPNSETQLPISAYESVRPPLWKGRLNNQASEVIQEIDPVAHRSLVALHRFSFDLSKLDYDEKTLVTLSYTQLIPKLRRHFHGPFSWLTKMSDEDIMRWLLREVLVLHEDIMTKVESRWTKLAGGEIMIGVHVRFADLKTTLGSTYNAVDELIQSVPNYRLLLATDDIGVQNAMIQRYKNVVTNEKWFPPDEGEMHLSEHCPDRLQNAIDALIDMYTLAKCQYLIFARSSTFSYISSLISTMPASNIIDIERNDPLIRLKKMARRLVRLRLRRMGWKSRGKSL